MTQLSQFLSTILKSPSHRLCFLITSQPNAVSVVIIVSINSYDLGCVIAQACRLYEIKHLLLAFTRRFLLLKVMIILKISRIIHYLYAIVLYNCIEFVRPFKRNDRKCIYATQYYNSGDPARQKELDECISYNLSRPWIAQVVIFYEQGFVPNVSKNASITLVPIETRLSYKDVFDWFDLNPTCPNAAIIFSNTDILITNDVRTLLPGILKNDFLALTRYESISDKTPICTNSCIPGCLSVSQDTWIFLASSVSQLSECTSRDNIIGILGCESFLLGNIHSGGFRISNPCFHVKTIHKHNSMVRSYNTKNRILGVYAYPRTMSKSQFLLGIRYKSEIEIVNTV